MALTLPGIGVSRDRVIGRARLLLRDHPEVVRLTLRPDQIEDELARLQRAVTEARTQLLTARQRIPDSAPSDITAFLEAHLLMLEDSSLNSEPAARIRNQLCNAEWALQQQQQVLEQAFSQIDDPYLRSRIDDIGYLFRMLQRLLQVGDRHNDLYEPVAADQIVISNELAPSDLLVLHHRGVVAIITERGGPLSHTAILARSLALPAVMGVARAQQLLRDGETLLVDGTRGMVLADLDAAAIAFYRGMLDAQLARRAQLRRLKDLPARSRDGVAISLQANIELPGDLNAALQLHMEGVGLFRTEFLFMNRRTPPDEEEQFRVYRSVVQKLAGAPLTIRTIDLGLDKGSQFGPATDSSPLGLRGLRLSLKEQDLFLPQLRAILRASAWGPVQLLLPMVTTITEVEQVERQLDQCRCQLQSAGLPFAPTLPLGAVIEVPAAALCADTLAQRLDFLSIGTNDLIQYTLATNRTDEHVNHLYQPLHPAVLKLIAQTINAGQRHQTPVAMCGEMAGDPSFTRLLLGLGLRQFSMPPAALLEVKQVISESYVERLAPIAHQLLACRYPNEVMAALNRLNQ